MRLLPIALLISLVACGLRNQSVEDAHILRMSVFSLGGDAPEVELDLSSGSQGPDCVQASSSTRALFDGRDMRLWQEGGAVGSWGDSQDCHPPSFLITLPDAGADGDHTFQVIEGGRQLTLVVAHYLVHPTLQLDPPGPWHAGQDAGVRFSPSDADLRPIQSTAGVNDCAWTPMYFEQDGGEVCVYPQVDGDRVSFRLPEGLQSGDAELRWCVPCAPPQLPIVRCEGADACSAGVAYGVDPLPIAIAP